jgi:adenylyltransferase/sulfurtransferase
MPTTIYVPTPLRQFTDARDTVQVEVATVGEALAALTTQYPGLKQHLYTDQGKLRHFVNVYVNDDDIRYLEREATALKAGDTISLIPAVAGGAPQADTAGAAPLPALTNDEVKRYSRHLILPEVGVEGQRKLKAASVLLIGAGGLGSPAALYLAAAGVGRLGIVDFDVVDESNLQRQIMHSTADVGRSKLASARARLTALNPALRIDAYDTALSSKNALEIFAPYDVIVDGTDNFPTRYLVNDACVLLGKPNAYGSIFRFEGQASVFATKDGPCYRCLYPEPPPPGLVPSCAEGGVLGVLPGVIGTIQATEAIKLILGIGETLAGRLVIYDALRMKFRELKARRDPECPVCGAHPTVRALIDYEQFCGLTPAASAPAEAPPATMDEITPHDLKARMDRGDDFVLLDVREPHELQICSIPGYVSIPLGDVPKRVGELDPTRDLVVMCRSGARSGRTVAFLKTQGFTRIANLTGGVLRWIDDVDPTQPKY